MQSEAHYSLYIDAKKGTENKMFRMLWSIS